MQDVDPACEPDSIDGAVRIAPVVLDQFQHPGTAEPFQRSCVRRRLAALNGVERDADRTLDGPREPLQRLPCRADPYDQLGGLVLHYLNIQILSAPVKVRPDTGPPRPPA